MNVLKDKNGNILDVEKNAVQQIIQNENEVIYLYKNGMFKAFLTQNLSLNCSMGFGNLYRCPSSILNTVPINVKEVMSIQASFRNFDKVAFASLFNKPENSSSKELPRVIVYCSENTIVNFTIDIFVLGKWK